MYPATYLGLFPAFPRDDRAFVAMSFDYRFDVRWQNVIAPGIRSVRVDNVPLEPHRVDLRRVSDSVLTEILDGIGRCRVFVADITSIGDLDGRAIRNANVMYEVGLAHAVRLPEEVILLRSDDRELIFDVANIRVHRYDPDGSPETARRFVGDTIVASLREVDLRKGLAVRRAAESLDFPSWMLLVEAHGTGSVGHPSMRTVGQVLGGMSRAQALARLLDIGALQAELISVTPELLIRGDETPAEELVTYRITPFGAAIADHGVKQMGLSAENVRPLLERMVSEEKKTQDHRR